MATAYRVTVDVDVGQGVKLHHNFERIIDDDEQAREFGSDAASLFRSFQEGFTEHIPDE